MDRKEPRSAKITDVVPKGLDEGHMSSHQRAGTQQSSMPNPLAIVVDPPGSLLCPSDEKPSLPSLETQCQHCSKDFSTCQCLSEKMRMHSEKEMGKPDEEPVGLIKDSTNDPGMALKGPDERKVCNKRYLSTIGLGGHMLCHRYAFMQPERTLSPPDIVVDLPASSLVPSDEKPSLPSFETQCLHCSKEFSTCHCLSENMRMHSEKKAVSKLDEEPAGLMEASVNGNGDHGHDLMIFSAEKNIPTAGKNKMHHCPNCGKDFKSYGALGGHRSRGRCHTIMAGEKGANRAEGMKDSKEIVSSGVNVKERRNYYCKNCGEPFNTFQKLGRHRSKCKSSVQSGPEKFFCKYCGKDFPSSRSASSHMGSCQNKEAPHNSSRKHFPDESSREGHCNGSSDP